MNYWPRWIGSIQKKTSHLSLAEMGAYDRLLDHYYANESPLPCDLDRCCRICGASRKVERKAVESVLREFFVLTDAGYANERAGVEVGLARSRVDAARANGALGGRPKKNPAETQRVPAGNPAETQNESSTTTTTIQKRSTSSVRASRLPEGWEPGSDGLEFAEKNGLLNGRASVELAKFRDYWTAKSGAAASKTDWLATWRNWVRNAAERSGSGSVPSGETVYQRAKREQVAAMTGGLVSAKPPGAQPETFDVSARIVG